MNTLFGPWATAIDANPHPQLSAFWRQRMTRLGHVSQTSPALTRGNLAILALVALLIGSLPTLRASQSVADEPVGKLPEKAIAQSPAKEMETPKATTKRDQASNSTGLITKAYPLSNILDDVTPKDFMIFPGFGRLMEPEFRKSIKIGADQEKQLKEISTRYQSESKSLYDAIRLVPLEKRKASWLELSKRFRQESASMCAQIVKVLSKHQMAAIRQADVISKAYEVASMAGAQNDGYLSFRSSVDLSTQQREQFSRLIDEMNRTSNEESSSVIAKIRNVFTREQYDKFASKFADEELLGPIIIPSGGTSAQERLFLLTAGSAKTRVCYVSVCFFLDDAAARKSLGLTAQQELQLQAISRKSKAEAQALSVPESPNVGTLQDVPPEKKHALLSEFETKQREFQGKLQELGKSTIRQIESVLTPKQFTALKEHTRQTRTDSYLSYPDRTTLEFVGASPEQREKIRRLAVEYQSQGPRLMREAGEKALALLTPDQRKKLESKVEKSYPNQAADQK